MRDDDEMRGVLLQLALTSNGRTASWNASGGHGEEQPIPRLGHSDAPHLYWRQRWENADTEEERARVLLGARDELDRIRRSRADRTKGETADELAQRIIEQGEGFPAREVAIVFRTGELVVRRARANAGRDEDLGRLPAGASTQPSRGERQARVRAMLEQGMSGKQISFALGIPYSTVLRDLGRKA